MTKPMETAPRDGRWVWVRHVGGDWFLMKWWAEGTSWNEDHTDLVQTGVWTDDDGWLEPREVDAWQPADQPPEGAI